MSAQPTVYVAHTVYNGGEPDDTQLFLDVNERFASLRERVVDMEMLSIEDAAAADEEELRAALEEALSPTRGTVRLSETAIEVPTSDTVAASLKQLFVIETSEWASFTSLYRSTQSLFEALTAKILDTEDPFFSAEVRAEVLTILTRGRTGVTLTEDIYTALLSEVRDALEDGPYAVWVHDVALPA